MAEMPLQYSNHPWIVEYGEDILNTLKNRERERMPFQFKSPQLEYRQQLVPWICDIADRMRLCDTTLHLSIYLLDLFMDNHNINVDMLTVVGLVCILLAAKFEETDNKVPSILELNVFGGVSHSKELYRKVEAMAYKFFNYNLMIPTAAHFLDHFLEFALAPQDLQKSQRSRYLDYRHSVRSLAKSLLKKTLNDVEMHHYYPSILAAACIYVAREKQGLSKWTVLLEQVTGLMPNDLLPYIIFLDRHQRVHGSPDQGYASDDSSPEPVRKRRKIDFI